MARNLRFIFGGLAFATAVAIGEVDASIATGTNNAPSISETKVPEIGSFNLISSNNISYVELKGKINSANSKKYTIQSTTNLSSNIWQDICPLEDCTDSKRIEFYFLDSSDSSSKYYRLNYKK